MREKSSRKATNEARADIAAAISAAMRVVKVSIEGRTDENIRLASDLPQGEAPAWYHTAKGLATATVKADQAAGPTVNNQLNLVLVDEAKSKDEWLESIKPFRELAGGARRLIEGKASESTSTKK